MSFNENSRVKIPAILHLMRLGYSYIPLSQQHRREDTNIFEDIFVDSLMRINPEVTREEIVRVLDESSLELDYEDLGRVFHQRLTATSGIKLIDFKNFNNNSFHITAELTAKNGDEEFRPDISVLINGMPLAFVEVKKPHNKEGVIAERSRVNARFKNKHFRRFANITQLMVFSNNMEYEDGIVEPVYGAFYATAAFPELLKRNTFSGITPQLEGLGINQKLVNMIPMGHSYFGKIEICFEAEQNATTETPGSSAQRIN